MKAYITRKVSGLFKHPSWTSFNLHLAKFFSWMKEELLSSFLKLIGTLVFLFVLVITYQFIVGIRYSAFTTGQIQANIEQEIGSKNLDYRILKADFYGFGIESIVIVTFPEKQSNFSLAEDLSSYNFADTRLLIFDPVQTTALEKQIYDVLYKKQYDFSLTNISEKSQNPIEVKTKKISANGKDTVFFCINSDIKHCGGIRYHNKYEVIPLIEENPFTIDLAIENNYLHVKNSFVASTEGEVKLTEIISPRVDLDEVNNTLYIGEPINVQPDDITRELYQYSICRFYHEPNYGIFKLRTDYGAIDCLVTEKEYNFLFHGQQKSYQDELLNFSSGVFEFNTSPF